MWSPAIYLQFPNEAAARAAATSLGVVFPESGEIPTGNENYAMHAPMQPPWITLPGVGTGDDGPISPGVAEPGYWAMLRFNMEWPGYTTTVAALEASGVVRDLATPPVVWA